MLWRDDESLGPALGRTADRTDRGGSLLPRGVPGTLVETGVLFGELGAHRWSHPSTACMCPPRCRRCLPPGSTACRPRKRVSSRRPRSSAPRSLAPAAGHRRATRGGATWRSRAPPGRRISLRNGLFPEREYTFKHALTHEVAYGSLLQERRRVLHARIVEALEALAGDRVAEQVERLAHHALRGEVWDKALAYCRQAGEKAWRGRPTARPWGPSSRRSVPSRICRSSPTQRAGHRPPARPAHGAPSVWRLWAYPGVPARGRVPRCGPRRPSSAGTGLGLSVKLFPPYGRV